MCEFPIEMRKKFDHRKWKLNENINQIWLNGFGMLFTNESTAEMFVYAFFHSSIVWQVVLFITVLVIGLKHSNQKYSK